MNAIATQDTTAIRFSMGRLLITPGAKDALCESNELPTVFLMRHSLGDWGDCCEEDRQANDWSLANGARLFSVYHTAQREKIWIITESDRSATTILLPSEY